MAAYSTGASWGFPEDLPGDWVEVEEENDTGNSSDTLAGDPRSSSPQPEIKTKPMTEPSAPPAANQEGDNQEQPDQHQQRRRTHYPPRQCRICLEQVQPTFHQPETSALPAAFQPAPRVTYESPKNDGGRLLRPCKCKGSQKYVHEECLSAWRLQDPLQKRNYWNCPTCGYSYKLQRLSYGRWISSTAAQIALTILIFITAMFVLGFVADPIINLYLDPVGAIASMPSAVSEATHTVKKGRTPSMIFEDEAAGWMEHFIKGLASLGLVGFAKFLLSVSPFHFFNRGGVYIGGGGWGGGGWGNGGGRGRGNTGRDRLNQLNWLTIMIGVATVVYAVWKGVRAWSRRTLEKAGERVMDVPGANGDEDEDD